MIRRTLATAHKLARIVYPPAKAQESHTTSPSSTNAKRWRSSVPRCDCASRLHISDFESSPQRQTDCSIVPWESARVQESRHGRVEVKLTRNAQTADLPRECGPAVPIEEADQPDSGQTTAYPEVLPPVPEALDAT